MNLPHPLARRAALPFAAALALVGVAALPSVAAPAPGYDGAVKASDGSIDFSNWTALTPQAGAPLAALDFTRNGIDYRVEVNAPATGSYVEDNHANLFANVVTNRNTSARHTYSWSDGSGRSSQLWYKADGDTSWGKIAPAGNDLAFYTKTYSGGLAVAQTYSATAGAGRPVTVSEVLDVTTDGRLTHHVTFTNDGAAAQGMSFYSNLDTELDGDDLIPLVKAQRNSLYIQNATFRLYLGLVEGDRYLAGPWGSRSTLNSHVDVNDPAAPNGSTLVDGEDSNVAYVLQNRDFPADSSLTLAYDERIYEHDELVLQKIDVVYVDDQLSEAVEPAAGTVTHFEDEANFAFEYTEAQARAGIPTADYEFVSIADNPDSFDDNNAVDQVITVHLNGQFDYADTDATRTIHYTGAGDRTPADVVQDPLAWTVRTGQVTGTVQYRTANTNPAVASPAIEGLVASPAVVPASQPVPWTTAAPTDETVIVTYSVPPSPTPSVGTGGTGEPGGTASVPPSPTPSVGAGGTGEPGGTAGTGGPGVSGGGASGRTGGTAGTGGPGASGGGASGRTGGGSLATTGLQGNSAAALALSLCAFLAGGAALGYRRRRLLAER
jgi:hypothetical protein